MLIPFATATYGCQDSNSVRCQTSGLASVEDQATANDRIPLLLQTPAAVRWISAEPPLANRSGDDARRQRSREGQPYLSPLRGYVSMGMEIRNVDRIDWVVVGGESTQGKADASSVGARPAPPVRCRWRGVSETERRICVSQRGRRLWRAFHVSGRRDSSPGRQESRAAACSTAYSTMGIREVK